MEKIPTSEVVKRYRCDRSTAAAWALKHGVELVAERYFWSEEDLKRFEARPKPGKRAKRPKA